ncbi:uncharacterized protein [Procambarus clarkii]|uniref:uncharacterized protein isoform X1 n=1 Tax=Procambarus clarkii TaxID=6728 RepID=UPI001E673404|nr:uncharacterized protein LOC123766920 [Procambarus clarkii]
MAATTTSEIAGTMSSPRRCSVNPLAELLILCVFGTVPALVVLVVLFHSPGSSVRGFSLLVVVSVIGACVSLLLAHYRLVSRRPQSEEDLESGGADASTGEADSPPKYDSVMAKPPPYDQLYTGDQTGNDSTHDILLDHDLGASLTTGGEKPDASPPSYSEVTKTGASQSLDQSAHQ